MAAASVGAGACGGTVVLPISTSAGAGGSGSGTSGTGGTGGSTGCPPTKPECACPAQLPQAGTSCDPCCSTEACHYAPAGQCGPIAQCMPSGVWSVEIPPCPPPPPCPSLTTPDACEAESGCRWLVPGCSTPTQFTAGCFDATDCDPTAGCPSGQSCIEVDTDPCWNSNCTTCSGKKADICYGPG